MIKTREHRTSGTGNFYLKRELQDLDSNSSSSFPSVYSGGAATIILDIFFFIVRYKLFVFEKENLRPVRISCGRTWQEGDGWNGRLGVC